MKWQTQTASQEDVAYWGIIAPPNDRIKLSKLKKWMKKNQERVNRAKRLIEKTREFILSIEKKEKQRKQMLPP